MNEKVVDSVATPKVSIDWYRAAPWWRLASQTLPISWRASHLFLSALGVLASLITVNFVNWLYACPSDFSIGRVARSLDTQPFFGLAAEHSPMGVWRSLAEVPLEWLETPTMSQFSASLIALLALVAIWSFVGGCLARRSVIELGTRLTAPWNGTIRIVSHRWLSMVWSILMPLVPISMVCLFPMFLGFVSNAPWMGSTVSMLLLIPLVFLSLGLGWCGAISLLGFPFAICAVVSEKRADAFDGVSRSAAYVFQRPLTLILCVFAFEMIGRVGSQFVDLVLTLGFDLVKSSFESCSWFAFSELQGVASWINYFVPLLLTSFGFSFFWTASAATYLIVRRDVDNTEYDQIDMDERDPPQPLPDLKISKPTLATPADGTVSEDSNNLSKVDNASKADDTVLEV